MSYSWLDGLNGRIKNTSWRVIVTTITYHSMSHAHSKLCLHRCKEYYTRDSICPPVSLSSYLHIVQWTMYFSCTFHSFLTVANAFLLWTEWVTYTFVDKRISMALVACHYSINKFPPQVNKNEIIENIKASTQQSVKTYKVSHCDPFLKKMERVLCVRREDGNRGCHRTIQHVQCHAVKGKAIKDHLQCLITTNRMHSPDTCRCLLFYIIHVPTHFGSTWTIIKEITVLWEVKSPMMVQFEPGHAGK
jgi:hypothetical protein